MLLRIIPIKSVFPVKNKELKIIPGIQKPALKKTKLKQIFERPLGPLNFYVLPTWAAIPSAALGCDTWQSELRRLSIF